MIRISNREVYEVDALDETSFEQNELPEHFLRDLIYRNAEAFLAEIEEDVHLLPPERMALDGARERIDLLGVDRGNGTAVIFELKRGGRDKGHMLQALSYAAMISRRSPGWFEEHLTAEQRLELGVNPGIQINHRQRIVLIAEGFSRNVVIASHWLSQFGVDVKCVEFKLARSSEGIFYLRFHTIYPPPYVDLAPQLPLPPELETLVAEIKQVALARKEVVSRNGMDTKSPSNIRREKILDDAVGGVTWEEFVGSIRNPDLVAFLRRWEESGERILPQSDHRLVFPSTGERWRIEARPTLGHAWVRQRGRFRVQGETDVQFWARRLDDTADVRISPSNATRLHFKLVSPRDFVSFWDAIHDILPDVEFHTTTAALERSTKLNG